MGARSGRGAVGRGGGRSEGVVALLAGADAHDAIDRRDPHLAVTDLLGAGSGDDDVDDVIGEGVGHDGLHLTPTGATALASFLRPYVWKAAAVRPAH